MSSLRNSVPRRPHRERSQPSSRQKWGLLEKHKDYSLRAADFNAKRAKLKVLSSKTRDKHPDEFAFGMVNAQQGKLGARKDADVKEGGNRLSHDAVRLLKTQDAGYLRNAAQRTRKEMAKVEEEIGVSGSLRRGTKNQNGNGIGNKVIFTDEPDEPSVKRRKLSGSPIQNHEYDMNIEEDEAEAALTDLDEEHDDLASNTQIQRQQSSKITPQKPLSKKQLDHKLAAEKRQKLDRKRRKRLADVRTAKLAILKQRQHDIMAAADVLDLQRAKMAKIVGGVNKLGVKFKVRERKK